MNITMPHIMKAMMAMIAALVLAFGAHTVIAAPPSSICDPGRPGYVDECPPLNAETCDEACKQIYGEWSMGNECAGGCCTCAVK